MQETELVLLEQAQAQARVGRRGRVLVVQTYVPQYRKTFFEGLKVNLASKGVHLDLLYSDPTGGEALKEHAIKLPWAIHKPNRYVGIGRRKLVYQPAARLSRSYDLVIVEQANRLLVNPLLMGMSGFGMTRLAYWGHGKDFQGGDGVLGRALKRALLPRVDWWFAYNEMSAAVVRKAGFPDERITRVMNTIDNEELEKDLAEIAPHELEEQRQRLGIRGQNVCIYIGGMYDKKRLPFLLAVCEHVRREVPDFEIIFLGGGVDKPLVDRFAAEHNWALVRGPTFGREKAITLKLAKLLLMPGLVGLGIIDAFTAQVPIVTTNVPYHSPEIDYLITGVNGEMVQPADSVEEYAKKVVSLLRSEAKLSLLREGCRDSARKYAIGTMVSRFADGVLKALPNRAGGRS